MSTIQETHSFGEPLNMMLKDGIDCESPANMALKIAKSASPDSTGKEILQRFRDAVSQSAQRRQKQSASPVPNENSDSLIIYKDDSLEIAENNETNNNCNRFDSSKKSLSVKERVQQSLAQRRVALKEKSMNVLPSSTFTRKSDGLMKKNLSSSHVVEKQEVKSVKKDASEGKQNDLLPSALEDVVSVDSVSLELNTLDSDSAMQDSVYEQPVNNITLDPVHEVDEKEEDLNQSQNNSAHAHVSNKGITVEENELLSLSDQCGSVNSESSSLQDSEILESISRSVDSKTNSDSKVSRCREPLTPSENSVQTFSIEDRFSEEISPEQFKHIFSPTVCNEFKSLIYHSSPGLSSQISEGGTVIPDISISDSSYELGSPTEKASSITIDYKENLALDQTTEQTKSSIHYLEDVVSPVSKLLVTGLPPSNGEESYGLSRATASSLIERNKTLMKEVRFADQTCVELSVKNSSMLRDMERVKGELLSLSATNKDLHNSVVRSSKVSAKLEEERDFIKIRMEEERSKFEMQIKLLQQNLEDEKKRNSVLSEKLEEKSSYLSSVEKKLVSMSSAYKVVHEERNDAKKTVANLTEKLAAIKTTNVTISDDRDKTASANLNRLKNKVDQLEKIAEDRLFALDREREINEMLEEQVVLMKQKCVDIEDKLEENLNASFSSSIGSPSTPSTFSTDDQSNELHSTEKLREKLSSAKSECEEYKRELDSIISQIKKMQRLQSTSSPEKMIENNSPASKKLLSIAKELAKTCEIVNTAAGSRVGLLEQRNHFLTQSISHLQEICLEDSSRYSGDSALEELEPRSLNNSPPKDIMSNATECGVMSTVSADSVALGTEMKRKNEEIGRLKNEINAIQRRYGEAIDELNEVHEIANFTEHNLMKEQDKCRRYEDSIENYRFQLHESSNKIRDSHMALQSKESEVQALEDKVSELEDQIHFIEAEWHHYNGEYDAQLANKNENIRLLSIELDEMREKYKVAEHQISEKQSLLAAEQNYREKAEDSLQEYQRIVKSLENQLHEAVTVAKSSEKELEELNIELHNAYQSIRLVEKKYSEIIDESAGERKKNEEAYANLEVVLRERENQICDIESQYSKAKSDLESLQMQNKKLCEEMNVAHETISSLRIESDEHEQKYQQLLEEYRDARSIDDSQLSEKDALITKLQRKNESLERKRARLRDYVNSLNAKCSAWEESMQEQQTEASTFRTKYLQAKSQIEQLMKELTEQRKTDMNLSCEDCKYLRRALVMEAVNNSQKDNKDVEE